MGQAHFVAGVWLEERSTSGRGSRSCSMQAAEINATHRSITVSMRQDALEQVALDGFIHFFIYIFFSL